MRNPNDRTAELYRSYGPRVYRRCLRLLSDEEAAADATQEVFLKLLVNMSRLQDREQLLPWMLEVARNHCLNLRRAARNGAAITRELGGDEPHAGGDLTRALLARTLLDRVDPAMRRVVLVVVCEGVRYEDAAVALGMSPDAVARKVQRFLAKARKYMTQSEHREARQAVGGRDRAARKLPSLAPAAAAAPRPTAIAPAAAPAPDAKPASPANAASVTKRRWPAPGDATEPAAA